MKKIIVGNWKMNGSTQLLQKFAQHQALADQCDAELVICPPSTLLSQASNLVKSISVGAQDCGTGMTRAHTGDLSAEMLATAGAKYVIVGHSERRKYQRETNDTCASKVIAAQKAGLKPIFCIGETEAENNANLTFEVLANQLDSLSVHAIDFDNIIIAYEPIWAIGAKRLPDLKLISTAVNSIKYWLIQVLGMEHAQRIQILYGGSVDASNAADVLNLRSVNGVLVGGASLCPESFLTIAAA
jgi:triosephosphate isomerase